MLLERISLKDTTCPLIRLETARRKDKSVSFSLSLLLHILIFSLVGISLVHPVQFGVDKGEGSIEVNLLAQDEEQKPSQEVIVPFIEEKSDFVEEQKVSKVQQQPVRVQEASVATGAIAESLPNYLNNPAPTYPHLARSRGQQGVVMLIVQVDAVGHPKKVEIKKSSGYRLLDEAAVKAVWKWSFQPATLANLPVESVVNIPIRFELQKK